MKDTTYPFSTRLRGGGVVVAAVLLALAVLLAAQGPAAAAAPTDARITTQVDRPLLDIADDLVFKLPPTYNNYFTCAGDWVYTDFVDLDGDDAATSVVLWAYRPGHGWSVRTMDVSDGYHGVFWYAQVPGAGDVTSFSLRATDEDGLTSSWVHQPGCP